MPGKGEVDAGFYQNAKRPEGQGGLEMLARMNGGHHEQLANWAFAKAAPRDGARMLDLGCGGGANLLRLLDHAPHGHAVGVDYSPTSVEVSRETCADAIARGVCDVVEGDVSALPFEGGAFDYACAFETVYFWPDLGASLGEAFRVLRAGGRLVVCNEADGTHESDYEMTSVIEGMRVYRPEELDRALRKAGFCEVKVYRDEQRSWIAFEALKPGPESKGE